MGFNPDNVKVTSGRDSNYRSSDVKGRPTSDPEATKDFKKILDKDAGEKDDDTASKNILDETDGIAVAMDDEIKKKAPASLFDLTAGQKSPRIEAKTVQPEVAAVQTTTEDATKVVSDKPTVDKPVVKEKPIDASDEVKIDKSVPVTPVDKDKFTTRFSTEQTDLSYVNPLAASSTQQPDINLSAGTEKTVVPVKSLQDIINQMIANVSEIKNTGKTETIVTLKHPPLFEGAQIVVTSFDSAKNEFNISIENLKQEAKNLMDLRINRDNLLLALEQKGYAVHILATTTVNETRVTPPLPQEDGRQERREQGEQGQQQQQRNGRERQT